MVENKKQIFNKFSILKKIQQFSKQFKKRIQDEEGSNSKSKHSYTSSSQNTGRSQNTGYTQQIVSNVIMNSYKSWKLNNT